MSKIENFSNMETFHQKNRLVCKQFYGKFEEPIQKEITFEQVGEYYLKTWNVKRDVWLSVCRKGSAVGRCLPEKIALEQVFL